MKDVKYKSKQIWLYDAAYSARFKGGRVLPLDLYIQLQFVMLFSPFNNKFYYSHPRAKNGPANAHTKLVFLQSTGSLHNGFFPPVWLSGFV